MSRFASCWTVVNSPQKRLPGPMKGILRRSQTPLRGRSSSQASNSRSWRSNISRISQDEEDIPENFDPDMVTCLACMWRDIECTKKLDTLSACVHCNRAKRRCSVTQQMRAYKRAVRERKKLVASEISWSTRSRSRSRFYSRSRSRSAMPAVKKSRSQREW